MTNFPGHQQPDPPEQPAGAGFPGAAIAGDPPGSGGAWRALDASANRAAEALRVIEDGLRFGLNDAHLTAVAKRLRHDLCDLLATQPLPERIRLRDVAGDVGPGVGPVGALPRRSPGASGGRRRCLSAPGAAAFSRPRMRSSRRESPCRGWRWSTSEVDSTGAPDTVTESS